VLKRAPAEMMLGRVERLPNCLENNRMSNGNTWNAKGDRSARTPQPTASK
jgi:hypothetical protein